MTISGPTGTGSSFQKAVAKFKAKGKTDLQARRIVAGAAIENELKRKKKRKKK